MYWLNQFTVGRRAALACTRSSCAKSAVRAAAWYCCATWRALASAPSKVSVKAGPPAGVCASNAEMPTPPHTIVANRTNINGPSDLLPLPYFARQRSVPPSIALSHILPQPFPILAGDPVEVPDHAPVAQRQFALQLARALHPRPISIHKTEVPFLHPQDRDIGRRANRQTSQFLVPDLARGRPGRTQDHFIERHADIQELRHYIQHVLHARVHATDVQVGGDRIRPKPLAHGGHCLAKKKTSPAMAHIEDDPAPARFQEVRQETALVVEHGNPA